MATPGSLVLVSGGAQDGIINTYYSAMIQVQALDTVGQPMVNEPIVFSLPAEGPAVVTGVFAWSGTRTCTAYTNASGVATSEQILANGRIGGPWLGAAQFVNATAINTTFGSMYNISNVPYGYYMQFWGGNNLKAAINTAYAGVMSVKVNDQFGNPWTGSVTFTATSGYGTWATTGTNTAVVNGGSDGVAYSPTLNASGTAGAFTVQASTQASPHVAETANATWTNVDPAIVASMSLVSGGSQKVPPSTLFPNPLVVRVNNGLGQGIAGITVTFTAPGSGASCTFTGTSVTVTAVSDANGRATTVPNPKSNATLGNYNVVASCAGAANINVPLTNGLNYLPEVCTPFTAPTAADTVTPGTTAWLNPNRAYNGNTSGASLQLVSGVQTQSLFVYNIPAAVLADIHDLAKINSFRAQFEYRRSSPGGITAPSITHTGASSSQNITGATDNTYVQQNMTFTAQVFPSPVTGAMIKSGNYGINTSRLSQSTPIPLLNIRFVLLSVCYQNPDLPPDPTTIRNPLIFCEA